MVAVQEGLPGRKDLRPRHALRWLCALLVSLAVHYWLFYVLTPSAGGIRPYHSVPARLAQRMEVRLVQPSLDQAEPPPSQAPSSPEQPSDMADLPPPPQHTRATPLAQVSHKASARSDITFYTVDEVDQPAHPRLDWEFPADSIAAAGLRRMIIQLWILDDGKILDVDIISTTPATPGEQVKQTIAQWLMQTDVTPAIKNGHRVASLRTLEIVFDQQP
jgi:hypothetical protein